MIDWAGSELYFERRVSVTAAGEPRTRAWAIQGFTPDATKADPGAPQRLDPHPDDSGLVLDSIAFTPTGYGTQVSANYVPSQYTGGPPPPIDNAPGYIAIDTTFENVDVQIPVYTRVRMTMGDIPTIPYVPVSNLATFRYSQTVHRITLNATVSSGPSVLTQLNLASSITSQTNKIHTIGGVKYRFVCDRIERQSEDQYGFIYRWIQDPGVVNTLVFEEQITPGTGSTQGAGIGRIGSYFFPQAVAPGGGNPGFIIEPFKRIDIAPAKLFDDEDANPQIPPVVVSSPSFVEDANGWQTLPGVS